MTTSSRTDTGTSGVSLLEMLVALVVGLVVLSLGLATLGRFHAARADMSARTDALTTLRVGRHVLRSELREGLPGRDWTPSSDSIALRAFRGLGRVCAVDSIGPRITVAYRGSRMPDPSKDSVLLVTEHGLTGTRALVRRSAAPAPCVGAYDAHSETWTLDQPVGGNVVAARVFERGSYHLAASALRYRRGASGRQPLTPEVLAAASGLELSGARLGLSLIASGEEVGWSGFLAWLPPE
jgi:hypothetical protein